MSRNTKEASVLQERLGYAFKNPLLLGLALKHPSCVEKAASRVTMSNQRLEYLGDAVLELVISDALYKIYPKVPEGELTKRRASLVQEDSLFSIAKDLGLGDVLQLSHGEERMGGRGKPSILSDALEAVFGAIYIDGGFDAAKDVILRLVDVTEETAAALDAKTALQEILQQKGLRPPEYRMLHETGPAHDKRFVVEALIEGEIIAKGEGRSKKNAEQMAAKAAIDYAKRL